MFAGTNKGGQSLVLGQAIYLVSSSSPVEAADDDLALAIDDQDCGYHGSRIVSHHLTRVHAFRASLGKSFNFLISHARVACSADGVSQSGKNFEVGRSNEGKASRT